VASSKRKIGIDFRKFCIYLTTKHYLKFLTLWKNSNPGIAEVKDAKKRLAGLQNH
jgi:hypothetical protein